MRSVPNWPAENDVVEPVARVVHGGKDREFNSLSLSRELPSSMHAQVARVGGLTQATGSVEWAALEDVATSQPTAFNRKGDWPPRVRDSVQVYTGCRTATGEATARQLNGHIASSSGDPMQDSRSGLIDPIARLSQKITLPPLQSEMPPLSVGGLWRGLGLYPTFYTDLFARAGRFYSTPGMAGGCVFSAPLMGSTWPERGTLERSLRYTDANLASQGWRETPWGMGGSDLTANYSLSGDSRLNRAMEITALFSVTGTGNTRVGIVWGTTSLYLVRYADRAEVQRYDEAGGVATVVCTMAAPASDVLTARFVPSGSNAAVTLRDATGQQVTGTVAVPAGSATTNATAAYVRSTAVGAMVGGVQVSFPGATWTSVNYVRSAFITPSAYNATLVASPPIKQRPARDLLEEQATAELAALWIDGDGYLHWMNRDRLMAQAPVTTLTTLDHLKNLRWKEDFSGVASKVEVTGRKVGARLMSKDYRHEVWRSNYSQVEADGTEVFEELIHPDADEDWIQVDTLFNNTTNQVRGSDVALYFVLEQGTEGQAGYLASEGFNRDWVGASVTRIDDTTYKVITNVWGVSTAGWDNHEFSLRVPTERQTGVGKTPMHLAGMNFPVLRAMAKTMWEDVTYTANAGAWDAPVLTHDVGWWVQNPTAAQAIANLIASSTTLPRPILEGVEIVPDARLERGDVVTISDPGITGVHFTALVVGITDEYSSNPIRWSQSCDFRIIDYTVINPTLAELDAAWAGQLLSALDAARAGETLTQFDTTPLKGAPA
ncbi:hypothetical protein [Arthrobacter sp. D2-10]